MTYDELRRQYRPDHVRFLLIAESPPPAASIDSSRHFYRADRVRHEDRLFVNTVRALYPETEEQPETELEQDKEAWLRKFQADGWYMIEALEESQRHEVTKKQRQTRIAESLPRLLERVKEIASSDTKIILIKSNVFDVAAGPLREAGNQVLNTGLVDYPGRYNQHAYREKLRRLASVR
jgi:hypothetical protein